MLPPLNEPTQENGWHKSLHLFRLKHHAKTLWLFTYSDLKTMVIPSTIFALMNGLALILSRTPNNVWSTSSSMMLRTPLVLFWAWINVLAFNIGNQRQARAIEEDRLNKPWRPLPAGRLTVEQAQWAGSIAYPAAFLTSLACGGGLTQSAFLFVLGYLYNDLGGADKNFITRNLLNACGFTSFASGALDVALQSSATKTMSAYFLTIAALVFTTVHSQDMHDQEGDSAAGRKTVPLVLGERVARRSISLAVMMWSWLCPLIWGRTWLSYALTCLPGMWVAIRTMIRTTVKEDRRTFTIYNGWLVAIYMLPLVSRLG